MSAKEQLNEMKKFRQMMEDIESDDYDFGPAAKAKSDAAEESDWDVEDFPLSESDGERPYVCHHNKKGEHECKADSSYGAAKKAADAWGLDSTAGISATLTDVKQSTQFVGETEEPKCPYCDDIPPLEGECLNCGLKDLDEDAGHSIRDILDDEEFNALLNDLDKEGDVVYGTPYFNKLYDHFLTTHADEIPVGHRTGRPDNVDEYVLDNLERDYGPELEAAIETELRGRRLGEGMDTSFESRWPALNKMLDYYATAAQSSHRQYKKTNKDPKRMPNQGADYFVNEYKRVLSLVQAIDSTDYKTAARIYDTWADESNEDDTPFGKMLVSGADNETIEQIKHAVEILVGNGSTVAAQHANWMNEASGDPDDTDWDSHWAREDGDDERADDLEADAEFARMDKELDESDDAECERCLGLGSHPGRAGEDCPECHGSGRCPKLEEGEGEELPPIYAIASDIIKNWKKVNFGAVPYLEAMKTLSTKHDDYGADSGSSILAYGLSNMSSYGGRSVHDPELAKKHRAQLKQHLKEGINLSSIVDSVLEDFPGQPKDYEVDPWEEADQREMADDMDDDFEKDYINPEIEDEELGLRFD